MDIMPLVQLMRRQWTEVKCWQMEIQQQQQTEKMEALVPGGYAPVAPAASIPTIVPFNPILKLLKDYMGPDSTHSLEPIPFQRKRWLKSF